MILPIGFPTSNPWRRETEALAALADATEAKTDDTANSGTSTATGGIPWELEVYPPTVGFLTNQLLVILGFWF